MINAVEDKLFNIRGLTDMKFNKIGLYLTILTEVKVKRKFVDF